MDSGALFQKTKKNLYVGYDHFRDGNFFAEFQRLFSSLYGISRDNSLERELDAADPEAFIRGLRDEVLIDCACMIVLCGTHTHADRFVDWEIKAALDRKIGIVGIALPGNALDETGQPTLPARLQRNFDGGYAILCRWRDLAGDRIDLTQRIAFALSRPPALIDNVLKPRA